MEQIRVQANTSKIIREIVRVFDLEYSEACGEYTARVPDYKKSGEGIIHAINFKEGLGLFYADCFIHHPLSVELMKDEQQVLQFMICLNGELNYTMEALEECYELRSMHGSISCSPETFKESIYIPANQYINICYLEIDRQRFFEDVQCEAVDLPTTLRSLFEKPKLDRPLLYTYHINLEIAKEVNEIKNKSMDGLLRRSFLEAKAFELFHCMITQYKVASNGGSRKVVLSDYDLKQIRAAKSYLEENVVESPTIPQLAKHLGLNTNKLKKGFRKVFGKTIKQFVNQTRMQKAKDLLIEGKLSIGEISEAIGYKNPSHFSKRFKEEFGLLPSEFLKSLTQVAV